MSTGLPIRSPAKPAPQASMASGVPTGDHDYVTLVSNDGFEFHVLRSCACVAGSIKRMLDPSNNFAESRSNRVVFETISGIVLEKVCEYFYYHEKYKDSKDVPDMEIPPELCLELLMAADYLGT